VGTDIGHFRSPGRREHSKRLGGPLRESPWVPGVLDTMDEARLHRSDLLNHRLVPPEYQNDVQTSADKTHLPLGAERLGLSFLSSKGDKFAEKLEQLKAAAKLVDKEVQTRGTFASPSPSW